MIKEFLRVFKDNTTSALLYEEDGNTYVLDINMGRIDAVYYGWGDEEDALTKYINECDEVLFISDELIDVLTDEASEQYALLTKDGLRKITEYLKEV